MHSMTARSLLRAADRRFDFYRRPGIPEICVLHDGKVVGHLESGDMPDRRPGRDQVCENWGHEGHFFDDNHHIYYRDSWNRCFEEILGQVPKSAKEALLKRLDKERLRV